MSKLFGNLLASFLTGFVAGIAPFLSMQLLPALLNPDLPTSSANTVPILLTGLLVGAVTAIVFGKTFESEKPREVFAYALGIPAVLIGTVSNLSTKFAAANQVSSVQEVLTATLLSPSTAPDSIAPPTEVQPPAPPPGAAQRSPAGAGRAILGGNIRLAQEGRFLVVIGEFTASDSAVAWDTYRRLRSATLRTERYTLKNLAMLRLPSSLILVYSRHTTVDEANRVYMLLRINDPRLPARVLRY